MLLLRHPGTAVVKLQRGCVATIGGYDGLHLGHRRILQRVLAEAQARALPSLMFSFEPIPREYFSRQTSPARLMSFREKFTALDEIGVDIFYCPRFDARLESLSPEAFVSQLLQRLLHVQHIVVGDDFRFGHGAAGYVHDLQRLGTLQGFTVEQVGSVSEQGERVSSSMVRRALEAGDFAMVQRLLGRGYRMEGRVVQGRQLGRQLGMPTANVRLNRSRSPLHGIFAVRVGGLDDHRWLDGVASIGTRPTVHGTEPLLEVHVFDFARDIYGAHIKVEFIAKLRDEVRFPDLAQLREQMQRDAVEARTLLARRVPLS